MAEFAVYTLQEDVYFTDAYTHQVEKDVQFVAFVAKNGRNVGKLHKIPIHNVTRIVDLGVHAHRILTDEVRDSGSADLARDMRRGK